MPSATNHRKASDTTAAVDQLMAENTHPHRAAIEALLAQRIVHV